LIKKETFFYDLIVVKILEPLFKILIGGITGFVFLAAPIKEFAAYIRSRRRPPYNQDISNNMD